MFQMKDKNPALPPNPKKTNINNLPFTENHSIIRWNLENALKTGKRVIPYATTDCKMCNVLFYVIMLQYICLYKQIILTNY